ncbi:protein POLLENLESS 3-like isoform X2 [Triticum urartu]|uniref:protein POLLENLESS 3-like isoform X2 n=1 Tax=Triticum urartu TaxID=4572 RepID=UPI0020449A44|nr:protein POLLENLESS 3-like isoform X2 [Triticum urartu]
MPSGGRRLPPWTSPRGAAEAVPQRWSPCTPAGSGNHVTPPLRAGCCSYRVTPPVSGGGCSRPPRAPPAVDSPYLRAKQAQLIEKDPNKAVPLFWAAINSGERIESALKDMATVLKQANRAEEAIEAIRSFRHRCPNEAQESLDNILLDLYKKCGRTKEQIEMLTVKLRMVDEDLASGRWKAKLSKSHGRVVYLSLRDEKARLLGNLAWAYMQSENYEEAEMLYRQALAMEADYNKECNLAICLMKMGKASVSVDTEKHEDCNSQVLPSPVTQLKHKGPQIMAASDGEKNGQSLQEYEYLSRLFNDAATPQSQLEKLRKRLVRKDRPNISTQDQVQTPSSAECLPKPNGAMDASENPVQEGKGLVDGGRKAWADMVEEEQQLGNGKNTSAQGESSKDASEQRDKTSSSSQGSSSLKTPVAGVPRQSSSAGSWRCNDSRTSTDENVNRNFARTAPAWKQQKVQDHSNRVCQMLNTMHLNEKAQGTKQTPSRSSAAQRSLFHSHAPFGDNGHSQGANHTEATNRWPKNAASTRPWRPQNRLRVFQEITNEMKQNVA